MQIPTSHSAVTVTMTISGGQLKLLACVILLFVSAAGDDGAEGFKTWFTTNKDEIRNIPIHFDNPLPKWLKGTLIRNGPGQFEMGKRKFLNAIDGYAKLSSWTFPGNGSAYFSTKFIRSKFYLNSVSEDDILPFLSFDAVDPPFNRMQKTESLINQVDNMNVNVYKSLDQGKPIFIALSDTWKMYEFNKSLTTLKSVNAKHPEKEPTGNIGFVTSMSCAHPVYEYGSSDTYFNFYTSLSLMPGVKHRLTLVRIKSLFDRQVIAEWETDKAAYMHSFSVTPNYVIFFVAPYYINIEEFLENAAVVDGIDWFSNENTSVYVVNIKTGQIHDMAIPNLMALHHINAFEFPDGRVVVDVVAHKDPFFSKAFKMSTIHNATARASIKTTNLVKRFIFDIKRNLYTEQTFKDSDKYQCASKLEVPTINENYRYKPYCFVYGTVYNYDGNDFAHIPLVKKDLCSQNGDKALYIPNHYPSEAWFIPLPPELATTEDDGYLISSFLDGTTKQSYVAIIDPKNMTISHKAMLPTVVPFTFHGRFFPDST